MPVIADRSTYDALTDAIAWERAQSLPEATDVQLYRRYAAGKQIKADDALTLEQQEALSGLLSVDADGYIRFADNLSKQVLSVISDRIELLRFDVAPPSDMGDTEGAAASATVKEFISETGTKCHIESFQGEITFATLRDGNHAVGVSWDLDSQRIVFHHEPWWDGECGMYVAYSAQGLPAYAVKEWTAYETPTAYSGLLGVVKRFVDNLLSRQAQADPVYRYRTVYTPDRIYYFRQTQGGTGWQPHNRLIEVAPGTFVEVSEVAWIRPDGTALNLPVIHFANGASTDGIYGESELAGGFIGCQDQINDTHLDLCANGRFTGYQRTYMTGLPTKDPQTGEAIEYNIDVGPGVNHILANPDAKMGVIPAGDSANLTGILKVKKDTACQMKGIPNHLITGGDQPSGEAIIRLEAPLVNKCRRQIAKFKPAFVEMMHRATEIANARAGLGLNEQALITAEFANPERRNPLELAQQVQIIRPDISHRQALTELGYSPEEQDRIIAEMEADDQKQQALVDAAQQRLEAMRNGDAQAMQSFMADAAQNRANSGQ